MLSLKSLPVECKLPCEPWSVKVVDITWTLTLLNAKVSVSSPSPVTESFTDFTTGFVKSYTTTFALPLALSKRTSALLKDSPETAASSSSGVALSCFFRMVKLPLPLGGGGGAMRVVEAKGIEVEIVHDRTVTNPHGSHAAGRRDLLETPGGDGH